MSVVTADLEGLRRRCSGLVVTSAGAGWDDARQANFRETAADIASGYRQEVLERLRRIRAVVDPHGVMHANHEITGADA